MSEYRLTRSGTAPLRFTGEKIACSDGEHLGGQDRTRYHDVAIYWTEGGKYVTAVEYVTRFQGEIGHADAEVFDAPGEVVAWLRAWPLETHVAGFPPGEAYAERQRALLADLRRRYNSQISEVLDSEEFAETCEAA